MINIIRILFLFFLYFSNVSTILSIYPILYYLIKYTKDNYQWYYFALVFSLYELGKFFSLPLWDKISNNKSNILLILISLFLISILNISFCFVSKLIHIITIRFLLGFCNHTGTFFKNIYIQMGFKKNNKIIIFLISIISIILALFLPSIIIYFNLGEKVIKMKGISMKNVMLTFLLLVICNILTIIFCVILIRKNKLRIKSGFYQMNTTEKGENSIEGPIKPPKNFADNEQRSNNKIIKVKHPTSDTNINIINQNKFMNETESGFNKDSKSDNKIEDGKNNGVGSLQNYPSKGQNIFNNNNTNNIPIQQKEINFFIIQIIINIIDGLNIIWTLVILCDHFKDQCLLISIYISSLKLIEEIILFPINQSITKHSSKLFYSPDFKSISKKMIIISIFLLIFAICISQLIFSIFYHTDMNEILFRIFLILILFRNILSGVLTQYYKIYNNKFYKKNDIKSNKLKKYNQYFGSISKAIMYAIGSFAIMVIQIIKVSKVKEEIFISLFYFHMMPEVMYIVLLVACIKLNS